MASGYQSNPLEAEKLRWVIVAFFVLLGALYTIGQNWYGLFDVDEAIFTQASVEMLESDNFIAPSYNGEPRYHKPPLIYWAQSLSLQTFGRDSLWGARLPSAIFGWLTILCFFLFTKNITGQTRFALTASAILGINLSWFVVVRAATADAALNFFILTSTMSLLSLLYYKSSLWRQALTGFLLAGGMLAKGPIALFIPGVATLSVWIFKPHTWQNIKATNPFVIGGALIAGIMPWMVLIIHQSGWDFFKEFWLVHNWGRFTGDMGNSQSGSHFYYFIVLLIGFFPWSLYAFRFLFKTPPNKFLKAIKSSSPSEALPMLGLVWGLSIVLLFSFSGTKLAHYIVPGFSGLALFLAGNIEKLPARLHSKYYAWVLRPLTLLFATIFSLLVPLLWLLKTPNNPHPILQWFQTLFNTDWPKGDDLAMNIFPQDIPLNIAPFAIAFLFIFGVLFGMKVTSQGFRNGIMTICVSMACILFLIIGGVVPMVDQYMQKPIRELAIITKEKVHENAQVHVYHIGLHHPSFRYVSATPFIGLDTPKQLPERLQKGDGILFFEKHRLQEVLRNLPEKTIYQEPICQAAFCVLEVSY